MRGKNPHSDRLSASSGRGDAKPTPIEQAAMALSQISDFEWTQVKDAEDRRRAEQRRIRDLSARLRELRRGGAR
jgi:hypothetical protein